MKRSMNSRRRGFTLIEVMLVMVILVILASLATVAIASNKRKANINAAKIQVGLFKTAIDSYFLDMNCYPTDLRELRYPANGAASTRWNGPYIDSDNFLDPWGTPYQIISPGRHNQGPDSFDVWSLGPDGQDNTTDDIGNWTS